MTDAKQDDYSSDAASPVASSFGASFPQPISKQDELNFACRWLEISRSLGGVPQSALMYSRENHIDLNNSDDVNNEILVESYIGNGSGLVMGLILHWLIKNKYQRVRSLNPLYRNFKTLSSFGYTLGVAISKLLPAPTAAQSFFGILLGNVLGFTLGLFSFPYWLVRKYVFKVDPEKNYHTTLARTGTEGWSKYGKTSLVYGTYIGQIFGFAFPHAVHSNMLANIAVMGGLVGAGSFLLSLVLVPAINYIAKKVLVSDSKENFRSNYVRSGITVGVSLGATVGFILGSVLFPGIGSAIGMAIGTAVGGILGGATLGVYGGKITRSLQKNWGISKDTDNSWDYATRTSSGWFACLGAAIGFFLPIPGGALAGAAIGGLIGGLVGWGAGFGIIRAARAISPEEPKAKTLPWTQRVSTGSSIGSIIFGAIGLTIGLLGGPFGAMAGAALGFAIGGFLGGIIGAAYERPVIHHSEIELTTTPTYVPSQNKSSVATPELKLSITTDVTPKANTADAVLEENTSSTGNTIEAKPTAAIKEAEVKLPAPLVASSETGLPATTQTSPETTLSRAINITPAKKLPLSKTVPDEGVIRKSQPIPIPGARTRQRTFFPSDNTLATTSAPTAYSPNKPNNYHSSLIDESSYDTDSSFQFSPFTPKSNSVKNTLAQSLPSASQNSHSFFTKRNNIESVRKHFSENQQALQRGIG